MAKGGQGRGRKRCSRPGRPSRVFLSAALLEHLQLGRTSWSSVDLVSRSEPPLHCVHSTTLARAPTRPTETSTSTTSLEARGRGAKVLLRLCVCVCVCMRRSVSVSRP